ncbi:MAG: hypothetical protein PF503_06910 [Desulfobacula sp.]|jgi:hypothetical protein|nr:hypothetical protein [Desulfobacula sp.]
MKESDFAKQNIAPDGGISRSSFSEAINHRGLKQLQFLFENLYQQAATVLPKEHKELGNLVSIDGSHHWLQNCWNQILCCHGSA